MNLHLQTRTYIFLKLCMVNAAYPEKDKSKQKIREEIPPLRENDPFSKQGNEISEWFDTGVKERLGEDIKI